MERPETDFEVVDLGDAIDLTLGTALGNADSDGQGRQAAPGISFED